MVNLIIGLFKNFTGIIKNLNLSKEQAIILVCVIALGGSLWATSHYKGKASSLEVDLGRAKIELQDEKKNAKIAVNNKEIKNLQNELDDTNRRFVALYKQYNDLLGSDKSYTEIMEGLGEINNTQDICAEWAKRGIHICYE